MNRAPGKGDTWWARHEAECGGAYTKIQEPAPTKKQVEAMSAKQRAGMQKNKLDDWISAVPKKGAVGGDETCEQGVHHGGEDRTSKTTSNKRKATLLIADDLTKNKADEKRARTENDTLLSKVACPICSEPVCADEINEHLDLAHPP
jgi:hypothetical protein